MFLLVSVGGATSVAETTRYCHQARELTLLSVLTVIEDMTKETCCPPGVCPIVRHQMEAIHLFNRIFCIISALLAGVFTC